MSESAPPPLDVPQPEMVQSSQVEAQRVETTLASDHAELNQVELDPLEAEPLPARPASVHPPPSANRAMMQAYLDTLQATAECMGQACPEVGGSYQQRLGRLRARLSFQSEPEALEQSAVQVRGELKEYAAQAARYLTLQIAELSRVVAGLEQIGEAMIHRQDYYANRMRQLALNMETAQYPDNPELINDVVATHSFELAEFAESLRLEGRSLRDKMQDLRADGEGRLADNVVTDGLTGLITRREMERRLTASRLAGDPPRKLLFRVDPQLNGSAKRSGSNEVIRQAAARLASHCRPEDLVCRWGELEFMVLYRSPDEHCQRRAEQICAQLSEEYVLDTGERVMVSAHAEVLQPEAALL